MVPDSHNVLPPNHLRDFASQTTTDPVPLHRPPLHRMLPCQRLLYRLCNPSLLEHPSPRWSAWEEAVYSASNDLLLRCRLDCDPRLRLPPTTSHGVYSRLVSWGNSRRSLLPWNSFRLRMGFGNRREGWNPSVVQFSCDSDPHRLRLGCSHHPEKRQNLAPGTALPTEVWPGLVSPSPHVTRRYNALRFVRRRTVVTKYPFLLFWSTIAIPTAYWIAFIELGIKFENDDTFQLTFGQVSSVDILAYRPLAPDTPIPLGDCCVLNYTTDYPGGSLGPPSMALVHQPPVGPIDQTEKDPIDHWASCSRGLRSEGDGNP